MTLTLEVATLMCCSQCNTEDNYKPINIYIILEVLALQVFLYLCFDRPGTAVSNYRLCHETLIVQDKTYRLPLQLFIHKQKLDYSIAKITPLDLHLQVSCSCQKDVPVYAGFLCNLAVMLRDRMQRTYCILLYFMLVWND